MNSSTARRLTSLLLLGALACAHPSQPQPPTVVKRASAFDLPQWTASGSDSVTLATRERVWEAILLSFGARQSGGEAEILSNVGRDFGKDPGPTHRGSSSLVLRSNRDSTLRPYDAQWLSSLVQRGLVRGVCSARDIGECPDTIIATFLTFGDPSRMAADTVSVAVEESAVNPADCRRTETLGGSELGDMHLARHDSSWTVVPGRFGLAMGSTWSCGNPPPEEQARRTRIAREDSVVWRTPSPIAGTYRFVVALPNGDSVVVFSRTEMYPMEPFRAWKEHDVSVGGIPITGYNLMADCALQDTALSVGAQRDMRTGVITCYHSVSVIPVLTTKDSTVWRGDPDAAGSAWILKQHTPMEAELHSTLVDDPADSNFYYMPGYWTVYGDGRVRFRRVIHDSNGVVVARLTGERVSNVVLQGHSR